MATRMQQRRGTAAQWTAANPILAAGELGYETDTNEFRIGDGVNTWSSLSPFKNLEDLGGSLDDYILVTTKGEPDGVASLNNDGRIPVSQLPDISALDAEVDSKVSAHSQVTTSVHGIADTEDLETQTGSQAKATAAIAAAALDATEKADAALGEAQTDATSKVAAETTARSSAISTHSLVTTNIHGISDTAGLATKTYADNSSSTAAATVTRASLSVDNVDNTSDSAKPVSTAAQTALDLKASLASPEFIGVPTAPTATAGTATTQVATTAFVGTAVSDLVASSPAALDTLNELATALGNDANFATTVSTSIGLKAPLESPTFTGTVTLSAAGIVFSDGTQAAEGVPSRTPIIQKTGSYTLSALTERDDLIEMGSGSAMTLTIPTDETLNFPIGTSLDILQTSTGQVTFAGAAGVTVNATPGLKLRTKWSSATLFKRAANTWVVYGDLTA